MFEIDNTVMEIMEIEIKISEKKEFIKFFKKNSAGWLKMNGYLHPRASKKSKIEYAESAIEDLEEIIAEKKLLLKEAKEEVKEEFNFPVDENGNFDALALFK